MKPFNSDIEANSALSASAVKPSTNAPNTADKDSLAEDVALDSMDGKPVEPSPHKSPLDIKSEAMKALRRGDFQLVMAGLPQDDASLYELFENIKIYQAELEMQNEELRSSQLVADTAVRRFTHLFTALPLPALVMTHAGHVIDCNEAARKQLQLDHDQGASLFFPKVIKMHHHLKLRRLLDTAQSSLGLVVSEPNFEFKSKFCLYGDLHVASVAAIDSLEPLFIVIIVDQTVIVQQRLALEARKKHFKAYFNASPVGMCALDIQKQWIEFNPALCQLLGYSNQALMEKTWEFITFADDLPIESRLFNKLIQGEINDFELDKRFIKRDGSFVYANVRVTCLRKQQGQLDYFVAIVMDITNRKKVEEKMQFMAHHDTLTNLPNRALLEDRFKQSKAYANRHRSMMAVLYLDLDHFKNINDSLGHLVGDKLLIQVAKRLNACIRDTDTVCRLGGDEFLILLTHLDSVESVAKISAKLLSELGRAFKIEMHALNISCSIGAAFYPNDGDTFEILLQNADTALYQAKFNGRNVFQYFTSEMNVKAQERLYLENQMRLGLAEGQFSVEFQPQIHLGTLEVTGMEALLRWQHPVMGAVSPSVFIPVAEDSGLMIELGKFALTEACMAATRLYLPNKPITVSVNISIIQFQRGNIVALVKDILAITQFPPHLLELEITESLLASDPDKVVAVIQTLKQLGVRFAIDDFGIGYSSFNYLKRFNVDKIKIDQSFITDIVYSHEDQVIVNAIIQLAHSLEMECIAEGVETEAQKAMLKAMRCDQIQGFVCAKSMSSAAMQQYLS